MLSDCKLLHSVEFYEKLPCSMGLFHIRITQTIRAKSELSAQLLKVSMIYPLSHLLVMRSS